MSILQAIILGLVQGLTEFLPVSSSGHLVLVPWWLGWEHPGLVFDTLMHMGTLLAVVAYFWRDWWEMLQAVWNRLKGREDPTGRDRLFLLLAVGSIPAAVIGFLFDSFFESLFARPAAAAGFLVVTGLLLVFAERWRRQGLPLERVRLPDAVVIGFAQALAIAPGISRSGSTIAAGLLRGLDRPAAARFSFLLGTPIFFGAGVFKLLDLTDSGLSGTDLLPVLFGFAAAAISGFFAIRYLLHYLQRHNLYVFAAYVWIVAALSLIRFALM